MKIVITTIQQFVIRSWIKSIGYANGRVQKEKTRWPLAMLFIERIQYLRNTHVPNIKVKKRLRLPGSNLRFATICWDFS